MWIRRSIWVAASLALAGCQDGTIGGDDSVGAVAQPQCTSIEPGQSPIRRMTRSEYDNTVHDLLGDTTHPAADFAVEEEALGFNNQASALTVTDLLAEQYMKASEALSKNATVDLHALIPYCDDMVAGPDTCAKQFIDKFGQRAWRRPLTQGEKSDLFDLYAFGRDGYSYKDGIELVIQSMLQSVNFLYRVEMGMPNPVVADVVPMTSWEIASRLSYMLWGSMPDDALFAAAAKNQLVTPEQIAAQARRMLEDPRARQAVESFHQQWLGLKDILDISKDPGTYPSYSPDLRALWKAETMEFVDSVIFEGAGDVKTLLSAPYSMMNKQLADFYGVKGPASPGFEKVELDPKRRSGVLTQASILAVTAKINQSSPVHRGKFVRERLLCQMLPPPPNNVKIVPPEVTPGTTTRQRFEEHESNPICATCHKMMDPIGFGFEHFDGVGLWRDKDQGLPIDDSGYILNSRESDADFVGIVDLAARLSESEEVRQCVATQWFRYAYGRAEQEDDQCTMARTQEAFKAAGYNIKELLVALTQTDAFRYRHRAGGAK